MNSYNMITKQEEERLDNLEKEAYANPGAWVNVSDCLKIRVTPEGLECQWGQSILKRGY